MLEVSLSVSIRSLLKGVYGDRNWLAQSGTGTPAIRREYRAAAIRFGDTVVAGVGQPHIAAAIDCDAARRIHSPSGVRAAGHGRSGRAELAGAVSALIGYPDGSIEIDGD